MSVEQVGTSRIGSSADCIDCGAGNLLSFNWEYARKNGSRNLAAYVNPTPLRWGTLYQCRACNQPWYLVDDPQFMHFVPRRNLPVIAQWDKEPIILAPEHLAVLRRIGRTPSDQYGNGRQFHETPCAVKTKQGEDIEMAIVSMQRHAPFEEYRNYRLASDIAEVYPSPFALPLDVRAATSRADEIAMGFAPTLVDLPTGESIIFNWTENFYKRAGCDTGAIVVSKTEVNRGDQHEVFQGQNGVVYFVADPA